MFTSVMLGAHEFSSCWIFDVRMSTTKTGQKTYFVAAVNIHSGANKKNTTLREKLLFCFDRHVFVL